MSMPGMKMAFFFLQMANRCAPAENVEATSIPHKPMDQHTNSNLQTPWGMSICISVLLSFHLSLCLFLFTLRLFSIPFFSPSHLLKLQWVLTDPMCSRQHGALAQQAMNSQGDCSGWGRIHSLLRSANEPPNDGYIGHNPTLPPLWP